MSFANFEHIIGSDRESCCEVEKGVTQRCVGLERFELLFDEILDLCCKPPSPQHALSSMIAKAREGRCCSKTLIASRILKFFLVICRDLMQGGEELVLVCE